MLPSEIEIAGTGVHLPRIGLGAMPLSLEGRPERAQALSVIRAAVEAGIRLIDTADAYALDDTEIGHGERLVAEALRGMGVRADGSPGAGGVAVVVATKGGRTRPGGRWEIDARPERLREACHASLGALGVDRIALYQLHTPDPKVPFAESVGALARLREEGKVAAVGLSNVAPAQIREASAIVPIASVQNPLSPWEIGLRPSPVVEQCRREGITFLAYGPLGGRERARSLSESRALRDLAERLGASPQEVALAWLRSLAPCVVPIPGATRVATVESLVRSAGLILDARTAREARSAFRTLPGQGSLWRAVLTRLGRRLGR